MIIPLHLGSMSYQEPPQVQAKVKRTNQSTKALIHIRSSISRREVPSQQNPLGPLARLSQSGQHSHSFRAHSFQHSYPHIILYIIIINIVHVTRKTTFPFAIATCFAYIISYHKNIPSRRGNESHVLTLGCRGFRIRVTPSQTSFLLLPSFVVYKTTS